MKRGFVLILTAPSGGGKGALSRHLLKNVEDIRFSVSTTTRPMRPGEVDGVHYFFVGRNEFENMIREGAFIEWAEVFGNFYGTSQSVLSRDLEAGWDVILDIDWQGARQIHERMPGDVVHVAIIPPSLEELRRRLIERGQDGEEVIQRRMALAGRELSHWREADYVIVNDRLELACAEIEAIVRAERLKKGRVGRRIERLLTRFVLR
ncbi:MAG: guanylate kinase [Magnetococcales bacterium]|nr:guanylate kinase [Magnetococcales bacterium]